MASNGHNAGNIPVDTRVRYIIRCDRRFEHVLVIETLFTHKNQQRRKTVEEAQAKGTVKNSACHKHKAHLVRPIFSTGKRPRLRRNDSFAVVPRKRKATAGFFERSPTRRTFAHAAGGAQRAQCKRKGSQTQRPKTTTRG